MVLTGLQKAYMKKLKPIEKASFTFSLLALETKDENERNLLNKIAGICKASAELDNPLVQAGRNLSLMLATEVLTIDQKSSILSAIDVLEKIRENDLARNN